ncbi:MAG: DUF6282 family protein [Proteobacteria bacterium]|nr:DUF6282 family protein [Pseudomonadota bacterium]
MKNNCVPYDFIDIHYHASPDLYERLNDALSAAKQYTEQKGIVVLRSHLGSTSVQATLAQQQGLAALPSLILNSIAGGIHYRTIMQALAEFKPTLLHGHMIVDFPTITGRTYPSKLQRQIVYPSLAKYCFQAETLFNDHYRLRQEVIDIIKMANDYPILLSTGHALKEEIYSIIEIADKYQLRALLINQPSHPLTNLKVKELTELATNYSFIYVEETTLTYLLGHQSKENLSEALKTIPKLIYSSDLGQPKQMSIADWYSFSKNLLENLQLPIKRQQDICLNNAMELLNIKSKG